MQSVRLITAALAGVAGVALVAGPALAQPPGTVDWTGLYAGVNGGWNSTNTHVEGSSATTNQVTGANTGAGVATVPPVSYPTAPMDYSDSDWALGGQLGYNRQMGHLVLGLEGDMDATGGRARQFSGYVLPATALTTGSTVGIFRSTDPDWTATVRGRVGWAMGPVLLYGTGGLALADVGLSTAYAYTPTATAAAAAANPAGTFGPFSNYSHSNQTLTGWTVGAGAEWRLTRAISVGAEYRHSDYGSATYYMGADAPNSTFEATRVGLTDDQVLAKVNFHFGHGLF